MMKRASLSSDSNVMKRALPQPPPPPQPIPLIMLMKRALPQMSQLQLSTLLISLAVIQLHLTIWGKIMKPVPLSKIRKSCLSMINREF